MAGIGSSPEGSASDGWRQTLRTELTYAVEAVDDSTALEDMLFGDFGIDDLRLLAFPLTILLGHIGHDFARVGARPDGILDARGSVGQNPELIIGGAATAKTNGHQQNRPPHGTIPPYKSPHKFKTLTQPNEQEAIRNGDRVREGKRVGENQCHGLRANQISFAKSWRERRGSNPRPSA